MQGQAGSDLVFGILQGRPEGSLGSRAAIGFCGCMTIHRYHTIHRALIDAISGCLTNIPVFRSTAPLGC